MSEFKKYFRAGFCEARPYKFGENLTGITVTKEDAEEVATTGGGMILRNPKNHGDQWYVSKQFFTKNYFEAEACEEAYRETSGMPFGLAIEALKKGKRVSRGGWNGKGMWLVMICPGNAMYTKVGTDGAFPMQPCIGMKTADNNMQPGWLASQADMLADDWMIVE